MKYKGRHTNRLYNKPVGYLIDVVAKLAKVDVLELCHRLSKGFSFYSGNAIKGILIGWIIRKIYGELDPVKYALDCEIHILKRLQKI